MERSTENKSYKERSEYEECVWLFEWAQTNPITKQYLIKHVNEGKRSVVTGHRLKMIGLRKGLPDYQLPVPNTTWVGLWIEMKTRKAQKRKKDENQQMWIEKLLKIGHYAVYAYGWNDAANIIEDYLANRI